MPSPTVTAVIPIHRNGNREWLAQAIGSLPTGTPYIVVENDGEVAASRNQGVRAAETEFVLLLDADDAIAPDALDFLTDLAWNVDVAYPSLVMVDEDFKATGGFMEAAPFCPNRLLMWNYIPGTSLVRRDAYLRAGGQRELPKLEDWDLWVRMHRQGARFKAVPEAHYYYRQTDTSRNKLAAGGETMAEFRARMHRDIVGVRPVMKAGFFYQATPGTTYWRCLLPARYLPGYAQSFEPSIALELDGGPVPPGLTPADVTEPTEDGSLVLKDGYRVTLPDHEGAAVFQFTGTGRHWALIAYMRDVLGIRCLVEVDDNYLTGQQNMKKAHWGKRIGDAAHTREGHRKICELADGVIVTTEYLAKQYRRVNPNVYVCPNQIDPQDWEEPEKPNDGVFRIGWFASASHAKDSRLVVRALEWAAGQKDVEVVTMGVGANRTVTPDGTYGAPWWKFPFKYCGWSNDLAVYRKMIGQLDVGLAPVIPDAWSNCRSDVKALEYAMAGAVPVLSSVAPYEDWTHGERCLKAEDAAGFYKAVKHLVGNRDEARALAAEARAHVLAERTVPVNIHKWEEAVVGERPRPHSRAQTAGAPSRALARAA